MRKNCFVRLKCFFSDDKKLHRPRFKKKKIIFYINLTFPKTSKIHNERMFLEKEKLERRKAQKASLKKKKKVKEEEKRRPFFSGKNDDCRCFALLFAHNWASIFPPSHTPPARPPQKTSSISFVLWFFPLLCSSPSRSFHLHLKVRLRSEKVIKRKNWSLRRESSYGRSPKLFQLNFMKVFFSFQFSSSPLSINFDLHGHKSILK